MMSTFSWAPHSFPNHNQCLVSTCTMFSFGSGPGERWRPNDNSKPSIVALAKFRLDPVSHVLLSFFLCLVKFFYSHPSRYGLFQLPEDISGRVMRSVWSQIVWKIDEKWVGRAEQGSMAAESSVSHRNEAIGK